MTFHYFSNVYINVYMKGGVSDTIYKYVTDKNSLIITWLV